MEPCLRWENLLVRVLEQHEQLEQRDHRISELEGTLAWLQSQLSAAEERVRVLEDCVDHFVLTDSRQRSNLRVVEEIRAG